ncbi:tetraspanin-8 [Carettochelys insculpta]|uniref:tetraspanin-8 n=1 Tax=Carettochelys insculpta TaxID=44489 RepID=UPI003EBB163B
MAGVSSCMKYSMFIFNFLFWVCGCIILGVSIWMRVSKSAQEELQLDSSLFSAVDLMIAVGSIIMVLGFLGCCGAMKESQCMLLLFFIGLLLILILQVAAGILGAVYKSQIEETFNKTVIEEAKLLQDVTQEAQVFQEKFQKFEKANQCCGLVKGYQDWGTNFNTPMGNYKICECTKADENTDLCSFTNGKYLYKKTCGAVIIDFFKNHMIILMGIAFGLACIEILGLGFSMSLYCQIQKK